MNRVVRTEHLVVLFYCKHSLILLVLSPQFSYNFHHSFLFSNITADNIYSTEAKLFKEASLLTPLLSDAVLKHEVWTTCSRVYLDRNQVKTSSGKKEAIINHISVRYFTMRRIYINLNTTASSQSSD